MENNTGKDGLGKRIINAVAKETNANPGHTANMWSVGEGLGLDRGETENIVMEMVSDGLLEIKSLSGGLSLTESGRSMVEADGAAGGSGLDLEYLLSKMESTINESALDNKTRNDLRIDIKTIELQSKRSQPLKPVMTACLASLKEGLEKETGPGIEELLTALDALSGK